LLDDALDTLLLQSACTICIYYQSHEGSVSMSSLQEASGIFAGKTQVLRVHTV